MRENVAILGSAPSKAKAPYADMSYDIWAISGAVYSESLGDVKKPDTEENGWNSVHRLDLLFDMHKPAIFRDKVQHFNRLGIPVMMLRKWPEVVPSIAYPVDDVAEDVGEEFSSSIAYMLALAIHRGYRTIRLDGVLMRHDSEYAFQRPGVKYYIGVARGRGIKIIAEPDSWLESSRWRYGYDDIDRGKAIIQKRLSVVQKSIQDQRKVVERERTRLDQAEGAELFAKLSIDDFDDFWPLEESDASL